MLKWILKDYHQLENTYKRVHTHGAQTAAVKGGLIDSGKSYPVCRDSAQIKAEQASKDK